MGEVTKLKPQRQVAPPTGAMVRVTDTDHRGYIEFQFSIGDPTLYLEMTLPQAAFDEFCATHGARHLTDDEARAVDAAEGKWRYGDNAQED